ncbi:MAG: hypothetical protein K0B15_06995 [Lentimicrobium sp.]|nr:hypothetical protein [Lentimicrobium sp.]
MFKIIYKSSPILIALLVIQIFGVKNLTAQESTVGNNLTAGISLGSASFFGDLSKYDYNPLKKIQKESGPSVEFFLGKRFNLLFELGLSLSSGKTKGEREDFDTKFKTKFNIYSITTDISIAEILFYDRLTNLDFGIALGASMAQFRSASFKLSDNSLVTSHGLNEDGNSSGESNVGLNLTGGYYISYPLNSYWSLVFRQTFEFLTTDNFDSYIGPTGISDRLLLTRLGLKYTINPTLSREKYNILLPVNRDRNR